MEKLGLGDLNPTYKVYCKHMRYAHATRTAISYQLSAISQRPLARLGKWPRYGNSLCP
ncbi:MAG: hypothetical protein F6K55_44625 [Moorea sp. SIO4A3]|nr:hypothetical protein [Moorena sp. SIO4A3]